MVQLAVGLVHIRTICEASSDGAALLLCRRAAAAPSYDEAALKGSSYLRLPKMLQFVTGNIGLHHVHHLSTRIPNYILQRAHNAYPVPAGADAVVLERDEVRKAQALGRGARAAGDIPAGCWADGDGP
jgi:hypothetical protein